MKHIKKIVALILLVCMTLSFSACSDTTWVYKIGDVKISSGLYIAQLLNAYSQAVSIVQSANGNVISSTKELYKETIDEKDAKTWILDKARTYCVEYATREQKFKELNLSFTEEEIKKINSTTESEWESFGAIYEKNGASKATYKMVIEDRVRNEKIFKAYYGKDGIEEVPVEKLRTHFKDDYASINMFAMYPKTGTELTDEEKKYNTNLKSTADKYVEEINSGKSFNKVKDEYSLLYGSIEKATAEDKLAKDEDSKSYIKKGSEYPSKEVVETIFKKPTDEKASVIKDGDNYYIAVRYDAMKDSKNFEDMRNSVLYDLKTEDFTKLLEKWVAEKSVEENKAAVKRYKVTNVDFTSEEQ